MKQFSTILKFELKYYLKNKIFVGITVFLVILIIAVMSLPRIIEVFEEDEPIPDNSIGITDPDINEDIGDNSDVTLDLPVMLIKAESSEKSELIKKVFAEAFYDYNVKVTDNDVEIIKKAVIAGEAECAFVMSSDTSFTYYVNNLSLYDINADIAREVLQNLYRMNAMLNSGMSSDEANDVMNIYISSETQSLGKDQMQNFFYTYIMIFSLYMVILLYGQMVSTNVATEKSSRAMEVLVTSAKPVSMMFGKVIASCLAGLIQLTTIFGSALFFYHINKEYWGENMIVDSIFNIPPELLIYMLVFFVLGFLIYAFLFGAIGSTATKLEDINTSTMPLMFMFVIAFIVVMTSMSSGSVDNVIMKICSYIPFTSPMAMFTRIAMSTVPWYEITVSISILVLSVIGIGFLAAKIYRVGVLLYGTTPKISSIIKAVWKA